MKHFLTISLFTFPFSFLFAAMPKVSDVTWTNDADARTVTVSYKLENAPAIVTLDVTTNGVSIGASNLWDLVGDVNQVVTNAGTHTVIWRPDRAIPGLTNGAAKAVVTAWMLARPPDYMVANLVKSKDVKFYATVEAIPHGLLNVQDYRTHKLVMRRVPAKDVTWTMGSIGEMFGDGSREKIPTNEAPHVVTMAADYYIGVFELTQAQWGALKGGARPAGFTCEADWPMRPVEYVSYNEVRHSASASDAGTARYPAAPGAESYLGLLRAKTGLKFDLPSEAQWEFACRGGVGEGMYNNGSPFGSLYGYDEVTNPSQAAYRKTYLPGRNAVNGGSYSGEIQYVMANHGTAKAGSYAPNKWGIYDMHGNVGELVLDWYDVDITGLGGAVNANGAKLVSDPTKDGSKRIARGGAYANYGVDLRAATRKGYWSVGTVSESAVNQQVGFRVACPLPTAADFE